MPAKKLIKKTNKPLPVTKKIIKQKLIAPKVSKISNKNRKREPLRRTKTMEESMSEGDKYVKIIEKIHKKNEKERKLQ